MLKKYKEYMLANFPQSPYAQAGNCFIYCKEMLKAFPELKLVWGHVYSRQLPAPKGASLKSMVLDKLHVDPPEHKIF